MAYIPVHLLVTFALLLPEVNQLETLRQPLRDQLPEDLRVVEHPAPARRHQLSQDLLRRQGVLRHLGFGPFTGLGKDSTGWGWWSDTWLG